MVKGECERPIGRNLYGRKEGILSHTCLIMDKVDSRIKTQGKMKRFNL